MANLDLVSDVLWNVTEPLDKADINHVDPNIQWEDIVLPGEDFTI